MPWLPVVCTVGAGDGSVLDVALNDTYKVLRVATLVWKSGQQAHNTRTRRSTVNTRL